MKRGRPSDLVLFVDVNFWDDPKIKALTAHERDQWLRILAEQLRAGNGSKLPFGGWGASRQRIRKYVELGLLEEIDGGLCVHKWDEWNGREAYKRFLVRQRVRRHRDKRAQ